MSIMITIITILIIVVIVDSTLASSLPTVFKVEVPEPRVRKRPY